jgi:Cu+-exporting ATPase
MAIIYTDAKIPTERLQIGDTVKVVPGDKVPTDGTVVRGTSSIDESAIAGEPVPVLKQFGDIVIGGTVNGPGAFDMVVTREDKDTALAPSPELIYMKVDKRSRVRCGVVNVVVWQGRL